jgi:hypothetical protein
MTIQVEGLPKEVDDDYKRAIERHRRTALKYLRAGHLAKGFGELVRASRAGPMTPRLASYLAALGQPLGNPGGAARLLETGSHDVAGKDRVRVLMRLARLLRRTQQESRAQKALREVLELEPGHLGAHRLLQALLGRANDWEGLDAALVAQASVADAQGRGRVAARAEHRRALLWSGLGEDPARAVGAYAQMMARYNALGEGALALQAALAQLEALEESAAPREAVLFVLQAALELAERSGDQERLTALKRKLPAAPPPSRATPKPVPRARPPLPPSARRRRSSTSVQIASLLAKGEALDADAYEALGTLYARQGDEARADQMEEVAVALRGKSRTAQPPPPALYLTAADRAGLRHPVLRNEAGELLSLVGHAVCRVAYLAQDRLLSPFRVTAGKGSPLVAEALLAAVRILGVPAPALQVAFRLPQPMRPEFLDATPHILIARRTTRRLESPSALRFFTGRALFAQSPDLLCLLLAELEPLERAFELLGAALEDTPKLSREARGMSSLLHPKGRERLRELHAAAAQRLNLPEMKQGAVHSINRAGLVVCGALGPALSALRETGASASEQEELVRFGASPRYLALRTRRDLPPTEPTVPVSAGA